MGTPTVRQNFEYQPGANNNIVPSANYPGCFVLVPTPPPNADYNSYYYVLCYLRQSAGSTSVALPNEAGILLIDVPDGMGTTLADLADAIESQVSPGPPTGVGKT
jgi:hypothetical protein